MMRKFLFPLMLLFVFGCEGEGDLIKQECLEGAVEKCFISLKPSLDGIGTCRSGTRKCFGGNWTECSGEVLPNPLDVCDRQMLDDDCDGTPNLTKTGTIPFAEFGLSCGPENVGECRSGRIVDCRNGEMICDGFVEPEEFDECDGRDNDCDGEIDELEFGLTIVPCYEFGQGLEDQTLLFGSCRPGIRTCRNGSLTRCEGQVRPSTEICNTLDDNCDGEVDEGQDISKTDVVFIVDVSGSFHHQRGPAFEAILSTIQEPQFQNFRFALINIGISSFYSSKPWRLEHPEGWESLVSTSSITEVISTFHPELPYSYQGGIEPFKDPIWTIIQEDGPIEWRNDSLRFIVVLGNEPPENEVLPHTDEEIRDILVRDGYYIFVMNDEINYPKFQTMLDCDNLEVEECRRFSGAIFNAYQLREKITSALNAVCF